MKRDINDFVGQKRRSKYYTVNNLPGFLDAQDANLFVMYAKARFQMKLEQTKSHMVSIFYLIISSGSMFDLATASKMGGTARVSISNSQCPTAQCVNLQHTLGT
jgi:hypothetical protein